MIVLARKELRDQRRGLMGWGGGLAAMVLMYSSFWPSVRDNAGQFESYLKNLPDALRNVIGELSIGTPAWVSTSARSPCFSGAWRGGRTLAIAVTAGLAVASFLLDAFAPAVDGLTWAAKLTPFYYYGENVPLRDGLDIGHALVLVGVAAVGLWLSILAFDRRDIHT